MLYATAREDLQPYVSAGRLARSEAFHGFLKGLFKGLFKPLFRRVKVRSRPQAEGHTGVMAHA